MSISSFYEQNYVPYSKKPSVAIVQSKSGSWFRGVRIENIAYPLTITAPQNALFLCLSEKQQPAGLWVKNTDDTMLNYWEQEYELAIHPLDDRSFNDTTFADLKLESVTDPEEKLTELLDQAVVSESNFPVSALIETERGFYSGVNVECSAWNLGLCAERVAIAKALTDGSRGLKRLHVHTRDGEFSSPCGACRQVIFEHMPNRQVHLHHADQTESIHFSNDLLPHSFSSSSLKN